MKRNASNAYAVVMNENRNPLQSIPKVFRFQIMLFLSVMWSTVFCLTLGSWLWWGEVVMGHLAIALGILITTITFEKARERSSSSFNRHSREDY
jgi:hypothetical protein